MEGKSSRSQGLQRVWPVGPNCQWLVEVLVFIQGCHGTDRRAPPGWYLRDNDANGGSLSEPCPVLALQPSWEHRTPCMDLSGDNLGPATAAGLAPARGGCGGGHPKFRQIDG